MKTSRDEAQWVLRAQCDDREAVELLLGRVQPPLHRYLCALVGMDDADDVLQIVLVSIFRKLVWLEDPALFRPWAFRIASRAAFRWLKKRRRWREDQADERAFEQLSAPDAPRDGLLSELHVMNLSPACQAVLVLHFQEGLRLTEVAAVLEIPLGTVKSRLAYGLVALRQQLGRARRL